MHTTEPAGDREHPRRPDENAEGTDGGSEPAGNPNADVTVSRTYRLLRLVKLALVIVATALAIAQTLDWL